MIERYTLPEMGRVWSEAHKYELWCQVETLVLEVHAANGTVPEDCVEPVRRAKPPTPEAVAEIEAVLKKDNVVHQRLPVSFAFHSRWIDRARGPFESFMRSIRCTEGRLPLVCCDQAAILSGLSDDYFWNVVRHPIRFREAVALLEQQAPHRYIDVGAAGTLATFLKYGLPPATRSTVHAILTPFGGDQKNLAAVSASILK